MAISLNSGRQEVLAIYVPLAFNTITSAAGAAEAVVQVPEGAIVVGGSIGVTTAFNSATTDVLDLGDGGNDDRYTATQVNLQTVGENKLDLTGYQYTAQDNIDIKWTAAGAAATAGAAMLTILYIVEGRAQVSEG